MNDECIHGLENQLCDLCFPKAAPVLAPAASVASKRASRAREAAAPTALRTPRPVVTKSAAKSTRTATATRSSAKGALADVGEQRIYHVTHISNLAGILESGGLLADVSDAWDARPAVDISSEPNREARRATLVAGDSSPSVAAYVPFFLSPDASVWNSIRSRAADPRLSPRALSAAPYDFVILVSTVKKVLAVQAAAELAESGSESGAEVQPAAIVVTDGDAAFPLTRFGATREAAEGVLRRLRADADPASILEAELLVEESFPTELVTLIGVANDKVRDVVKGILASATHRPKVAVYPPWFQPAEALEV